MQDQLSLMPNYINQMPKKSLKSITAGINTKANNEVKNASAMKAAKEFEASFLTAMLEQMFTGLEAEAPFGGGHSEKVYRSMMVNEYAKSISASGGIGLADHVYREILSAQEGLR